MKNQNKEIAQLQQELTSSPNNLVIKKRLGELLFQSGKFSEAAQHLEKLIEQSENALNERYLLATAYYQLGEWERAIQAIGEIENNRRAGEMYLLLAKIYLAKEDFLAAESCYDLALFHDGALIDPTFEQEFYYELDINQPELDASEQLIDEKLQRAADASDAEQFELAIEILHDVLAIDSNNSYAYAMLAACYFQMDKCEQAIPQIEKALELEPDNFGYYTFYGHYLKVMERYTKAKKALETAMAIDPNHSFLLNIYADLLLAIDQPEEAKKQALRAIELDPEQKNGYNMLGLAYTQLGMLDEAEDSFLKGLQLSPKDFECHYYYGEFLLLHKKNPEQAIVHLKKAYEQDPEDLEVKELLERAYNANYETS